MNIFVIIIIAIAVLIAAFLILALLVKKDYTVTRDITIDTPKGDVFGYIKLLKNQDEYSKWALMDPAMKKIYTGIDGTPGFVSAWDSDDKNVGKGEQEILKITEGERVDYELRFIKPFEGKANAWLSTDSVSATQTKVTWGFKGAMPYPMNVMLLFMKMDEMIGADLETGLKNLKTKLEK